METMTLQDQFDQYKELIDLQIETNSIKGLKQTRRCLIDWIGQSHEKAKNLIEKIDEFLER